jgi:hypothetical protein
VGGESGRWEDECEREEDENRRWEVRVEGKLNGRCEGVRKVGKNRVEGKEDDLGRWEM